MGLGNWMGYALSAGYYIGLDLGVGDTICEAFGYGYYVVDGLHFLVSFADSSSKTESTAKPTELPTKSTTTPAATDAAKTDAAAKTTADAAATKTAADTTAAAARKHEDDVLLVLANRLLK